MVGNDIVVIRQMSLLVVVHLLSRYRPSGHQGKKPKIMVFQTLVNRGKHGNYGVFGYFVHINYIRQGAAE